jgi:hypothetical protein
LLAFAYSELTTSVVAALAISNEEIHLKAIDVLPLFLAHRFPRVGFLTSRAGRRLIIQIRSTTAEALYHQLCDMHDDLDEELESMLLETTWTDVDVGANEAQQVAELLRTIERP